jgi:ubiquinone biosynthesis protein
MWATAEPVVGGWIAENLGPRGRLEDISGALAQMGRLLIDAPERLDRLARRIEADDDRRARQPAEQPRHGIAIPAALWAIVGILLFLAYHFS